ncbi:ATP-binding protein [Paenibacillus thermotolerans]|uniref:ATP-binding protein n=1 Tax=Paenibacillus thermotolerans TaxID=3027807 RepID=UPI002368A8F6|nr:MULTISPECIES: ATP-binding protein [unclassified Paenibacillus]
MSSSSMKISTENDIFLALHKVRLLMNQLGFSEMDKQKVIVTVSELTRNILDHAGADGSFACEPVDNLGVRMTFQDNGGGIVDVERILNGERPASFTGLGLGLAGAKRMMDEFRITTSKEGTSIVCSKWKRYG